MAVVTLAVLVAGGSTGVHRRVVPTARSFQRYFQDLKGAGDSVSPVERWVFSIILASADTHPAEE